MDISDIQQAFDQALSLDPRDGLTLERRSEGGHFCVEVRHKDANGDLRGFDVVAEPTDAEARSVHEVGQMMAQVVEQELGYGQLPARGEGGEFKRIVV